MQLIDIVHRGAVLTLLALCTHAQDFDAEKAFEIDVTDDPSVLATAKGLWLASAVHDDERELLVGHFSNDRGEPSLAMVATLVPNEGALQSEWGLRGRMYGELRLVGGSSGLGDAVSQLLQGASERELAIGIAGSWTRDSVGVGRFEAVVYAQDQDFSPAVPLAVVRGMFSSSLGSKPAGAGPARDLASARPLSAANPFGLAASGEPLQIEASTDIYHPLLSVESGYAALDPFSVPPRSIQEGEFVALMLSVED